MKAAEIILRAFARAKKERGLKVIAPNNYLSDGYIKKADHNLIVMTDFDSILIQEKTFGTAKKAIRKNKNEKNRHNNFFISKTKCFALSNEVKAFDSLTFSSI